MKRFEGIIRPVRRLSGQLRPASGGGGGGGSRTVEGVPPLSFGAERAGALSNWRIFGNGDGHLVESVNVAPQSLTLEQGTFDAGASAETDIESTTRVRTGVLDLPALTDTNWRVCVSWHSVLSVDTEAMIRIYNADGSYYSYQSWEKYRVSSMSPAWEYSVLTPYRQIKLRLAFRRTDNGEILPTDIYNVQIEYNRSSPQAYEAPVSKIYGAGDIIADSRSADFCKYQVPVTVGGSTHNIVLDEPLIIRNGVADYLDFKSLSRVDGDGNVSSLELPELGFTAGSNTLSVGTVVQPTKVSVTGAVREEES